MPCNCIKKSQEKLLAMVAEKNPERNYMSGIYVNQAYMIETSAYQLHNIFEAEYIIPRKNQRIKVEKLNILMDYCPMCGKKYKEEKEATDGL